MTKRQTPSEAADAWPDTMSGAQDRQVWPIGRLFEPPAMFDVPDAFVSAFGAASLDELQAQGIRPIMFEGEPTAGRSTRVFAWYGRPPQGNGRADAGAHAHACGDVRDDVSTLPALPAMVLVHGGGCTASATWVRHWVERGYAVLAIDHDGHLPVIDEQAPLDTKGRHPWMRHEHSGPSPGYFEHINAPPCEQWVYHAVASVIRAHSLLRHMPGIDSARVGVHGLSWGGFLTCWAAALDPRFALAISVYGCGHLGTHSAWAREELAAMHEVDRCRWLELWDPVRVLDRVHMPFLWLTGTNDFAYWLPALRRSFQSVSGPAQLSVRVGLKHSEACAWELAESFDFADACHRGRADLAQVVAVGIDEGGHCAWVRYSHGAVARIVAVELNYTLDDDMWPERVWMTVRGIKPSSHVSNHDVINDAGNQTGNQTGNHTSNDAINHAGNHADCASKNSEGHFEASADIPQGTTACFFNLIDEQGRVISSSYLEPS